jgi:ATP-dependent Lhr-like helicase
MLLTRRMERAGLGPIGFVATDYVLATWSVREVTDPGPLFDQYMLGDDLQAWMDESSLWKRTFRNVAIIAGLIERRAPGEEKSGRQVTFSADLIYDVLRRHDPDHVLLRATRADAGRGLSDLERVALLLRRAAQGIDHRRLDRISPLAIPVLLEIGRERVADTAVDLALEDLADELAAEAAANGLGLPPE